MYKKRSVVKLGRPRKERKLMVKSLLKDLIVHGYIRTTKMRAWVVAKEFDALMNDVVNNNLRSAYLKLNDEKMLEKLKQMNINDKKTGFSRIIKIGNRRGDGAELVLLEIIK